MLKISADINKIDDRLPTWPQDATAYIHATLLNHREDRKDYRGISYITTLYGIDPPHSFGSQDPLTIVQDTMHIYSLLAEPRQAPIQKRAEVGVKWLLQEGPGMQLLDRLPLGVAAPIREAVRTCQLSPPADWPLWMYTEIGRNDLAASASEHPDWMMTEGYRPAKALMVSSAFSSLLLDMLDAYLLCSQNIGKRQPTISMIVSQAKSAAAGEVDATSGVEMDDNHVGRVRFKDDRRLDEIGRMLNSSVVAQIKIVEKPEQRCV